MFTKITRAMIELIKQDASYLLYLGSILLAIASTLILTTTWLNLLSHKM